LADFDERLRINDLRYYARGDHGVIVGKVHGSVHWGVPFPRTDDFFRAITGFHAFGPHIQVFLESRTRTPEWIMPGGEASLYR
jgi:hypothetical protein